MSPILNIHLQLQALHNIFTSKHAPLF